MAASLCACTRGALAPTAAPPSPATQPRPNATKVYQPLATGNYWKYICNKTFTIEDHVVGTYRLSKRAVYALSLQIPSSPTKSIVEVQLLANDAKGNTWIYGYVIHGKIHAVKPAEIVAAKPDPYSYYNYPGPVHGKVTRLFLHFESTNKTPLGVFWVAPYFESNRTHNYGYSLGRGVMEEDHGPQYKYDCLIEKYVLK
jgi:hypothetical protein